MFSGNIMYSALFLTVTIFFISIHTNVPLVMLKNLCRTKVEFMIELIDGMYLYHGSYTAVEYIDLPKMRKMLDFGKGFYLTSSYEQQMCLPIVLMVQMPNGSILLQVTERVDCLINSSKSLNRQILSVAKFWMTRQPEHFEDILRAILDSLVHWKLI